MRVLAPVARSAKRLLDAVLRTSLLPVLLVATIGLGLGFVAEGLASFTGDVEPLYLWRRIGGLVGLRVTSVRLALFVPLQLAVLLVLRRPLTWLWGRRARAPRWILGLRGRLARRPWLALAGETLGTLALLAVLVPLVVQPTQVPLRSDTATWTLRAANLVDGTALSGVLDGMVGLYRRWRALPVPGMYSVGREEVRKGGLDSPLMSRWDPVLTRVTRDREHFAQTKAFLYVESAGRQYAVSHTGCAGLMQFCVSTAQRQPFRRIFGTGRVFACDCGGAACTVSRDLRDALETDSLALSRHPGGFPCDASDARFDGNKALEAGAAYTTELAEATGGNLYLMYIGYNSGPAVAKRLVARVGTDVDLDGLRPHLAPVLERWYGDSATRRANGLLDVHLPKLKKAFDHYY